MTAQMSRWSRWVLLAGLLVGASVAAMNWHNTWTSFAHLDVRSGRGATSFMTVESQATYQRWVLVALVSLVVTVAAMASQWLTRTDASDGDRPERLETTGR